MGQTPVSLETELNEKSKVGHVNLTPTQRRRDIFRGRIGDWDADADTDTDTLVRRHTPFRFFFFSFFFKLSHVKTVVSGMSNRRSLDHTCGCFRRLSFGFWFIYETENRKNTRLCWNRREIMFENFCASYHVWIEKIEPVNIHSLFALALKIILFKVSFR